MPERTTAKKCRSAAKVAIAGLKMPLRRARHTAERNKRRFDTMEKLPRVAQIWFPVLLAVTSICLNPYILYHAAGTLNGYASMNILNSACGLSVISGTLALAAYLISQKHRSRNRIVRLGKYLAFFNGIGLLALEYGMIEKWGLQLAFWLFTLIQNPLAYLSFIFIFAFLAAVILPIPVELALVGYIVYLQNPNVTFLGLGVFWAFVLIAVLMGIGKAVGAWVVFVIGVKVEKVIHRYLRWKWFQRFLIRVEIFCARFGYMAMFIILSIPMMSDTVPLYMFSILNKDGEVFDRNWFVLTNFWAGIARTLLVGIMAMAGVMSFGYVAGGM